MSKQCESVFVVDGDPTWRETVCELAGPMNVEMVPYAMAEEFLDEYDPAMPGCVVADLKLNGMDGLEFIKELERREYLIPPIIVTGVADVPLTVEVMQRGATALLEKPCSRVSLCDAIDDAMQLDRWHRLQWEKRNELQTRIATLSADEKRIMKLIIEGIPNKTIARRIGRSMRTVENRRQAIFQKTQTFCLAELVRVATNAAQPICRDQFHRMASRTRDRAMCPSR